MLTKRKLLNWTGKLLLVAIPAAISGFSSYAKSKVEAETQAKASYETLQKAVKELRDDHDALKATCEARSNTYQLAPPVLAQAPSPLKPRLSVGMDGGHRHVELPAKLEDVVQKYRNDRSDEALLAK